MLHSLVNSFSCNSVNTTLRASKEGGGERVSPDSWRDLIIFGTGRTSHVQPKGGYTLVTLPHIVTPYRDSVDETRVRITYQKLVTLYRYGLFRCAVGIWPSHQRDDTVTAGAGVWTCNVTLHVHTCSGGGWD